MTALPGSRSESKDTTAFALLCLAELVICADYGILPACILEVCKEFGLSEAEHGLLGTSIYTGLTLSVLVSDMLLSTKYGLAVVKWSLLLAIAGSLWSSVATTKYELLAARFFVGVMHGPTSVYCNVWVDHAAPKGSESTWMSLLAVTQPMGNILGYALASIGVYEIGSTWRVAFWVLGATLGTVSAFCACVEDQVWRVPSKPRASVFAGIQEVLDYPRYWLLLVSPVATYFLSTAVQYWAAPLLLKLGAEAGSTGKYVLLCGVPGPLLGNILGGVAVDKIAGGYRQRVNTLGLFFAVSCIPVFLLPWTACPDSIGVLLVAGCASMFFGSAIISSIAGALLGCVPPEARLSASSTFAFFSGALGFQLAPAALGFVAHWFDLETAWAFAWAGMCTLNCLVLGLAYWCERRDPLEFDEDAVPLRERLRSREHSMSINSPNLLPARGPGLNNDFDDFDLDNSDE